MKKDNICESDEHNKSNFQTLASANENIIQNYFCILCNQTKSKLEFSTNQLKYPSRTKCIYCVEKLEVGKQRCRSCNLLKSILEIYGKKLAQCKLCASEQLPIKEVNIDVKTNESETFSGINEEMTSSIKCFSCGKLKRRHEFSKTQLKEKRLYARCMDCLASLRRCSSCHVVKALLEFSGNQLRK